jgi:hypothetical protein
MVIREGILRVADRRPDYGPARSGTSELGADMGRAKGKAAAPLAAGERDRGRVLGDPCCSRTSWERPRRELVHGLALVRHPCLQSLRLTHIEGDGAGKLSREQEAGPLVASATLVGEAEGRVRADAEIREIRWLPVSAALETQRPPRTCGVRGGPGVRSSGREERAEQEEAFEPGGWVSSPASRASSVRGLSLRVHRGWRPLLVTPALLEFPYDLREVVERRRLLVEVAAQPLHATARTSATQRFERGGFAAARSSRTAASPSVSPTDHPHLSLWRSPQSFSRRSRHG